MSRDFVHLHLHTDYSLLESNVRIPALAQKLIELEMPGCAITDKGNLYGALSFYNTFKANNLKPIFGYQAFLTLEDRHDRQAGLKSGESAYYELVLLATNLRGYQNLIQLSSRAFTEGFYHKPRVDCQLLSEYSQGLIALSGGIKGLPGHFLKQNRFETAFEKINLLRDIFGAENTFLEIQDHDLADEKAIRRQLVELSEKTSVPLVVTNDVHYLNASDAIAHEVLLCIGAGQTIHDASRPNLGSPNFYLRSAAEMWHLFGEEMPSALRRTMEIFERCQPELPQANDKDYLPRYPIPIESECATIDEYFEKITWEGFAAREQKVWDLARSHNELRYDPEVYRQRLAKEIEIIKQMGYPGYFMIVWDFVKFARQSEIPVGPGRGSAAGSLVAYCLEITDIDPIQYDLLFERFLNPERVSMPDIDIDFCVNGRDAVIQHVINRYGRECVCQIITFGTMASKAVIKDVGRALAVPYGEVEKIAKLIPPPVRGRNISLTQALEQVPELKKLAADKNEPAGHLIDLARRLEGCARHTSVHAAGVVIAPSALYQLIPVATSPKSELTTQFAMSDLEKTGLLKMDFLALTTLTIISDCLKTLKQSEIFVKWESVKLDDEATMRVFGDGRTDAIFQFESPGMQEICRRLKPKSIEDLSALNALYRPGPLDGGMVDDFINRHRGQKSVRYIVPQMKDILSNTLGILVYQEQIMQLAQQLAGYSLGEADMMRRAMGKKKREEMIKHTQKFVSGAVSRGIKQEKAEQIFNLMAQFADYGFNRSHSVAYAYLAFQTAYLKAHYPAHFYSAVLSHETQDPAKIYKYSMEIQEVGLKLLPPDINESTAGFTPLNKAIRFGLSAIKGLGENSIQEIITAREKNRFTSLFDFAARLAGGVNRRGLESLINAGSFDSLNSKNLPLTHWRSRLAAAVDSCLSYAKKQNQDTNRGQHGLFGGNSPATLLADETEEIAAVPIWSNQEVWKAEKQAMGFYLTSHPLDGTESLITEMGATSVNSLNALIEGETPNEKPKTWTAGVISGLQIRTSKKGTRFAIFKLEDRTGHIKCLVWDEAFKRCHGILEEDQVVFVAGSLELENEGSLSLIVEKILPLAEAKPGRAAIVTIVPSELCLEPSFWEDLLAVLNRHRGTCQVVLEISCPQGGLRVRLATNGILGVQGSVALEKELVERGCQVKWFLAPDRETKPALI
ncbi:MAG: DNA polymerase III subunit alpha [Pyrinomonadaceae bacterium]